MAPLVAVDIGNSRAKFGLFVDWQTPEAVPLARVVSIDTPREATDPFGGLAEFVHPWQLSEVQWWISSVQRRTCTQLVDFLASRGEQEAITLMTCRDVPIRVALERPDMVGIDRLVDAAAANLLRPADRCACVVDLGSAITVDLVTADGVFQGGAILPGLSMSAMALHTFTDLLPLVKLDLPQAPPPLGRTTDMAMVSGVFWGSVGAIRELALRQAPPGAPPRMYITGGAGPLVAQALGEEATYVPDLTLRGILHSARVNSRQ